MIKIGINENVVLSKAEIVDREKGTLALTFREVGAGGSTAEEILASIGGTGEYTETGGTELTLRILCPLPPYEKTAKGDPIPVNDRAMLGLKSIGEKKNLLLQILLVFMTSDKAVLDATRGLSVTAATLPRFTEEAVLRKAMLNLAEDFVKLITPFLDKEENAVRLLLVRQSKTKPYATFREKFLKENPIIESMAVPKEASKLAFTKYEIDSKLDQSGDLGVSAEDVEAQKAEAFDAASVFGTTS